MFVVERPDISYNLQRTVPPLGTWVHHTFVWRKNGDPHYIAYYENGVWKDSVDSTTYESNIIDIEGNALVFNRAYTSHHDYYVDAEIDDLGAVEKALSDEQVLDMYNNHL